jgi:hypothetical protein
VLNLKSVAEVLFVVIGGGYINDDFGFSHESAGRGNASAMVVPEENWNRWQKRVMKNPIFQQNIERDQDHKKEAIEEVARIQAEIAEVNARRAKVKNDIEEIMNRALVEEMVHELEETKRARHTLTILHDKSSAGPSDST